MSGTGQEDITSPVRAQKGFHTQIFLKTVSNWEMNQNKEFMNEKDMVYNRLVMTIGFSSSRGV